MDPSQIQHYYSGSTIFLTGATGFVGKLIMEKLLRSCNGVKKVYILIRNKKEKSTEKRFRELLDNEVFELLKREQPNFTSKVGLIPGDCKLPDLGLNFQDRQKLIDEVNCVFHSAATIKYDEKLRTAAYINVRATRDALILSKQMKHLRSFVHISTAYSNCVRKDIDEIFYEPPISGEKLLTLVDTLDEHTLDNITPILLGKFPNTYTFTKCVAEGVVKIKGEGYPVAVVRPSAVISTIKEPLGGWTDNLNGPTGVVVGVSIGLIHTTYCNKKISFDMVPADFTANCVIAAAWDIGTTKNSNVERKEFYHSEHNVKIQGKSSIPIYNNVCSTQNPITWEQSFNRVLKHAKLVPSSLKLWHIFLYETSNYYIYLILRLIFHTIPAYIVDFGSWCIGKEPQLVKGYEKIHRMLGVQTYFITQEWNFQNRNTQALWGRMNATDKQNFDFDIGVLQWDYYFATTIKGGRVYLLKDPLDTLPQAQIKFRRLQIAHYVLVATIFQNPQYNPKTVDYDVAELALADSFIYSDKIQPIALHGVGEELLPGSPADVSGWGRTCNGSNCPLPEALQKVMLPKLTNDFCKLVYGWETITERMDCHNSGGPLVSNKNGGIVSWGVGCAQPRKPGVYMRVANSEMHQYINENL